jgi:hypothetical protein
VCFDVDQILSLSVLSLMIEPGQFAQMIGPGRLKEQGARQ